ncbi:MAG: hypothetical protein V4653_03700 [Pseudomonadota bacterium]
MIKRATMLLLLFARPAGAQQLEPQVATTLLVMIQAAGAQCQAGNLQACGHAQQLQQAGGQLAQAQFACQQGNQQACQAFQLGAQQVFAAYQQHVAASAGSAPYVQQPGFGGPGYSQDQMTYDHQRRMREMERNSRIQQGNAAADSARRDREHQRFMEQLRR